MNHSHDVEIFKEYRLKSDAERYAWASWTLIVVFSSLVGDSTILIASTKYKAFKLHKFTVTFIQHVAVSDFILAITYVAPCFASLVADGWAFGRALCYLQPYAIWLCCPGSMFLICGMTTSKFLQLKYPLRARSWSKKMAQKICAGCWILALYYPICFLIIDPDDMAFDFRVYVCNPMFSAPTWKMLLLISFVVIGLVPNIIIMFTTTFFLYKARKSIKNPTCNNSKTKLKWQGIITVVLTATVYVMSYLPVSIYFMVANFVSKNPASLGWFHLDFHRVAVSLIHTNIMANFFIYSLTVRSFRTFLQQMVTCQSYSPIRHQGNVYREVSAFLSCQSIKSHLET